MLMWKKITPNITAFRPSKIRTPVGLRCGSRENFVEFRQSFYFAYQYYGEKRSTKFYSFAILQNLSYILVTDSLMLASIEPRRQCSIFASVVQRSCRLDRRHRLTVDYCFAMVTIPVT